MLNTEPNQPKSQDQVKAGAAGKIANGLSANELIG
jgi:hypothetical protein